MNAQLRRRSTTQLRIKSITIGGYGVDDLGIRLVQAWATRVAHACT